MSLRAAVQSLLLHDLKFALRSAVRTPMFSLLAVITLALGIGANAALFAVVKPVLLDPLPYAEQDRLVRIFAHNQEAGEDRWGVSAGMVDDLKRVQRSFSETAAFFSFPQEVVVGGAERPLVGAALLVEPALFDTLGVEPLMGRLRFMPEELPPSGPPLYMVLTYDAWQRYTGGDPNIVGKQIPVFERPRTVVGVLPRGFVGPAGEAELYMPLNLSVYLVNPVNARRSYMFNILGRLAPDVELGSAQAELDAISAAIQREHPEDVRGVRFNPVPLRTALVGDSRLPLLILLASALLVLVIACANLAGAMLSRALTRRKEFAVRTALGASRGKLVRQLLMESTVLALAGGLLGIVMSVAALHLVRELARTAVPHFATLSLDAGVVAAVMGLTLVAGIAVGLLPAFMVAGANPQRAMVQATRGATESRRSGSLRGMLVAAQIALCLGLLVSAGLLTRSLWSMADMPVGVEAGSVVTARTTLPLVRYGEAEQRVLFQDELTERVRGLPGISEAATMVFLPQAVQSSNTFEIDGRPWPEGQPEPFVLWNAVSDDYFNTLRVPLLQGRTFDTREGLESPRVIVISDAMARRYWPAGDAIGARIRIGPDFGSPRWEVIGVVGDVRNDPARLEAQPMTYMSHRQEAVAALYLAARTHGEPGAALSMIERELAAMDPALPFHEAAPLATTLAANLAPRRLPVILMMGFSGLALLLAAVGVYAMFATMAAARERELGIRVALGATRAAIARLVIGQGARWLGIGVVLGAVATVGAGYALRDLLFGVSSFDPVTLLAAAAVLVGAAVIALLAPVRKATSVDPMQVLRSE
ncbi:MAG TPA: ABC transporter permease [Gammaproteobacteria bacterium]|nr:ABC transporter permease [Gammaproteobacteria bacterium]